MQASRVTLLRRVDTPPPAPYESACNAILAAYRAAGFSGDVARAQARAFARHFEVRVGDHTPEPANVIALTPDDQLDATLARIAEAMGR